ncbi:xanthine dehydrogenase accessory protein XdhC [Anderseniella sp. Alg231-50]|uniref:xanthine dehydrogenase accessory protein XdhC n=1 Tax=Anderseniella sp. Alg231-50 TaxID=1922226 RepID=UPI000D551A12
MYRYRHDIWLFAHGGGPFVLVNVDTAAGSAPRDAGTWMLVSPKRIFRTIGGGQLEKLAIDKARDLIASGGNKPVHLKVPLGPEIGQCCGGSVGVSLQLLGEAEIDRIAGGLEEELAGLPHVYVFGAGHVGNALCEALSLLPVQPVLIDTRHEELQTAPPGIETRLVAMPESVVRKAVPGSAYVILTHEHSLDFLIAREALARSDVAYVGMIGSKTKLASFRNWIRRDAGETVDTERLVCPIGGGRLRDKRPEVIAALVAAELVEHLSAAKAGDAVQASAQLKIVGGDT